MKIKNTILLLIILLVMAVLFLVIGFFTASNKSQKIGPVQSINNKPSVTPIYKTSQDEASESNEFASPIYLKREKLIEMANGIGIIHQDKDFSVVYDEKSQVFEVEILSKDTAKTKDKSIKWIIDQGIEAKEVCKLPTFFYVSSVAKDSLPKNFSIDQKVPGC